MLQLNFFKDPSNLMELRLPSWNLRYNSIENGPSIPILGPQLHWSKWKELQYIPVVLQLQWKNNTFHQLLIRHRGHPNRTKIFFLDMQQWIFFLFQFTHVLESMHCWKLMKNVNQDKSKFRIQHMVINIKKSTTMNCISLINISPLAWILPAFARNLSNLVWTLLVSHAISQESTCQMHCVLATLLSQPHNQKWCPPRDFDFNVFINSIFSYFFYIGVKLRIINIYILAWNDVLKLPT